MTSVGNDVGRTAWTAARTATGFSSRGQNEELDGGEGGGERAHMQARSADRQGLGVQMEEVRVSGQPPGGRCVFLCVAYSRGWRNYAHVALLATRYGHNVRGRTCVGEVAPWENTELLPARFGVSRVG